LGERLLCKQEVIGSIPFTSTNLRCASAKVAAPKPGGRRRAGQADRVGRFRRVQYLEAGSSSGFYVLSFDDGSLTV
jgi:hypothetical protein